MKKCVFAGTFDPPTNGHKAVIENCLALFDEVVVAVMVNNQKTPAFTAEQRLYLLQKLFKSDKRVKVITFDGAVVDLLEKEKTPFYVRGIRNTVDFEYENMNYFANRKLMKDIVTIYLPSVQENLHISSTLVRNSYRFGKDYTELVPEEIIKDVTNILQDRK